MKIKLLEIVKETESISSFRWQPDEPFAYQPGQWLKIKFSDDLKHHFTISSSPTESYLQNTTIYRDTSEFKKRLFALKVGDEVEITGPGGSFVLNESDKSPHLFIAGGIGITPFRSMLKYTQDKNLNLPLKLLYSVKNKSQAAFVNQLEAIVVETDTEGRLDANKIKTLIPDWQNRSWWIAGPPAMVDVLVTLGKKMGVPIDKVKSEEFTGYD